MKLHNAVQDQPIVSNVGQIGEFRIRNSAKAFNILSSGLYANKIKAIIRELSCNAVDSHVAAGKSNTPFDVHLPNQLEPHFSIRDYGTGLNHEQVTNIYTTYFESTKTSSNDFIGALGLGSKSPFSYTDNFTVTAIKDGKKGIYTAFINEQGVPSIALMMEEETTDPNGVEVKFSVNDRYDFNKFRDEARSVYKYFKLQPVVSGVNDFSIPVVEYETENIIPGVHSRKDSNHHSIAIMGNIAYPIQIPEADKSLGELGRLLSCGLVMEFNIGELDFQASREGLSYIPETIKSIKNKLEKLNTQLSIHIAQEADKIKNNWEKALYLDEKGNNNLWKNAVDKYLTDTKFEYLTFSNWNRTTRFKLFEDDLQNTCNILIRGFTKNIHYNTFSNVKTQHERNQIQDGTSIRSYHEIKISKDVRFVINDTKVGALERAKYHVRTTTYTKDQSLNNLSMFVIEPYDKNKPINIKKFKKLIANPPENYFMMASTLAQKERSISLAKNVTIMCLEERGDGGWTRRHDMVWRDAGKADRFDSDETYYYIPLSGYIALNKCSDVKNLANNLKKSKAYTGAIYGVRKSDIEFIKKQKNWVELDQLIIEKLSKMDKSSIMGLVKQQLDIEDLINYNSGYISKDSPFIKLVDTFKDVKTIDSHTQHATQWLCKQYDVNTNTSPQQLIDKYTQEVMEVKSRYPLLKNLSGYSIDKMAVAEYINLIDKSKGV